MLVRQTFGTLAMLVLWTLAPPARADVERFALVIGNDLGASHETPLRYAETDAERVHAALRDVGGFAPENLVLLRGEDADTVRSTLIALNDRLRQRAAAQPSMLLVYYSGHADSQSIHLRGTRLGFEELTRLVRGSSAAMRLLVVDACRSGVLTRVKGGRAVPPFELPSDESQAGEGFALLTASTADEDAQESDEIGASFFTHAFVSGLRGAADVNGDGRVSLEELHQYAYAATLRASSASAQGMQHPTFQYEVRGRESLVLATLEGARGDLARLRLPRGSAFLLFKGSPDGQVVAEVPERSAARTLSLPGGRYFVRGRAPDALLEGYVTLAAGAQHTLDANTLKRVAYARLVRKGVSGARLAHGPYAAATVRSAIPGASQACFGAALGYALHFRHLSLYPRLDYCRSGYRNRALEATTDELGLGLSALYTWDVSRLSISTGVALSAQLSRQHFDTRGVAPSRDSVAPASAVVLGVGLDLGGGFCLGLEARAETYLLRLLVPRALAEEEQARWDAAFAVRGGLGLAKLF
jgi:hypothetical protein